MYRVVNKKEVQSDPVSWCPVVMVYSLVAESSVKRCYVCSLVYKAVNKKEIQSDPVSWCHGVMVSRL